jgi:hypothetical protein
MLLQVKNCDREVYFGIKPEFLELKLLPDIQCWLMNVCYMFIEIEQNSEL